jgi:hypothetical protein
MLLRITFLLVFCALASGCTGSSSPQTAPVSGRVTYKGKALPNADVTFTPGEGKRAATGRTDAAGRFTLGTFSINDGALVGKHRVSVMARGPDRPAKPGEGSGMPGETVPGDPIIPTKYFSPDSSGLAHEVVRGSNHVELSLTD